MYRGKSENRSYTEVSGITPQVHDIPELSVQESGSGGRGIHGNVIH